MTCEIVSADIVVENIRNISNEAMEVNDQEFLYGLSELYFLSVLIAIIISLYTSQK